ncbi:TMV resistance protein N isoform X1 [Arachis ipaensis]|uniref:TMV resistance protein N isoform X1 n=2 Tax=Arachis ipaensis TaxID=130454 RepID=UPI000A2B4A87|nr:TMV resistance protein N isoform X1 [Arachis ipaensis]
MALQSPFSSSSLSFTWKYDVFISFRGQDTRYGFTGNLYKALCDKGIHTFFDDDKLLSGEEITPALIKAIEESRIAIVVLSPNYASSSFCLDELVHVLHCIKGNHRLVLPVFYEVDPSDVRHLKNSFGEAMAKHENRYKDHMNNKVDKWKKALKEVANLSGYHFKHRNGYEHVFIGNIVNNISKRIRRHSILLVADHPVGLESPVSEVASLLDVNSCAEVRMVGIHGIGGIGKTTVATAVYNLIADHFEGVCFLENVRENSNRHGLVHLQTILLSEILGEKDIKLTSSKQGVFEIQKRLCQKKVLLVLDDVDEHEQLKAIAGMPDWFGLGSRVIITTRDKHLLILHEVERTYEVQGLKEKESFDLLTWKAFKTASVSPEYQNVLNRAVTYASGLPLALEVIGSNLFRKDLQQWESALDQYEKVLDNKIRKILQVSFDALEKEEQSVFLDIACCFIGYESIENLLQAHYGCCMQYHIGVLGEKSLIRIDWCNNRVTMHDLIVDMGKEIVLEESPKIPGKRSRLWFYKDIVKVFEDNQGTSAIEIIYLERDVEVKWDGTTFKDMKNLKTLVIKNGCFSESPKHLPNSLRVLEWWKYPSKYFPHDFQPKELSILKLPHNIYMSPKLDILSKKLVSLKVLNFDYCNSLNEIVDVSNLQTLQEFSFRRCKNLVTVHSSVGFLPKLKILNAEYCCKLRSFPPTINLPSLEKLLLSHCSSLENFPEILEETKNLEVLYLDGTGIKDLPCSFRNFSGLFWLGMRGNYKMCKIPCVIGMMPRLSRCEIDGGGNKGRVLGKQEEGIHGIHTNSLPSLNLKDLSLMNSNLSDEFFPLALAWFPNVASLKLSGNNFTVLPECIRKFQFIISLNVDHSKYLREIIGIPPNLKEFSAVNCKSLSPTGTSVLLNQKLHEGGGTKFVMPGGRIPRWFEKRSRGASISFWFRGTIFPHHALCIAILLTDDLPSPIGVRPMVSINGYQFLRGKWDTAMDQLFILDLSETNVYRCNVTQRFEKKWNHAEVSYETLDYYTHGEVSSESIAKEIGMHLLKQKISGSIIEDIRFTDPYKMTQLIIMMMILSIALPNHKKQPLLLETCVGLWTLLFLTHTH